MSGSDSGFTGSIPALYDRYLGPTLFEPFASDLARRFAGFEGVILETAAGTGRVTCALAAAAPDATIVATDLNPAMLAQAVQVVSAPNISWSEADAQALPFADATFDAVVCQFGAMFFPDKATAYAEARRVLRPGGQFVFSVWDRMETNELTLAVHQTVGACFPDDPPNFLTRTPFGYHDADAIHRAVSVAGFSDVSVETVSLATPAASTAGFVRGQCQGSPLAAEIEARRPQGLEQVVETVTAELTRRLGPGPISGRGQALVVTARVPSD
ncbi:class I SAM-dependent methyltransferase [uncultured Brevundimonas sp.]|uniref:class I SAM-dependent methyltransferase n=1 Tax=uncultured Brevundimonas sp. TaxID=213418 RepID=UPI0030EF8145|tara:strand:- start:7773 stop:8585 length:813 start_codon:yes stop_codon:yes gene_type:complete